MQRNERFNLWQLAAVGGLAGGTAEVLWVLLYLLASDVSAAVVAQQVTASLWPSAAAWATAPLIGIAIHMVLALALAALCAPLLIRVATRHAAILTAMVAVTALTLVWVVNFFLVLPVINPGFVTLMPYGATLASKTLFALAMTAVVQNALRGRVRPPVAVRDDPYAVTPKHR